LIQKCLGDGPKLIRKFFQVGEEHAPYIVFIDEIHVIGTKWQVCLLYERRMKIFAEDFRKACEKVLYRKSEGTPEGLYL
ncbi:17498_t:CDS:2, partial [Cetraspora pellucida]